MAITADLLGKHRGRDDVVVLGLPCGGVPVGYEVAMALNVPLDILLVRKLGLPNQPELAMGAIASGGAISCAPRALVRTGGNVTMWRSCVRRPCPLWTAFRPMTCSSSWWATRGSC